MKDHYTKTVKASFTRWLMCLALITGIWTTNANAQVTVTVDVPTNTTPNLSGSYASLQSALNALNGVTAMSGPIVLTCAPGSETAPATGFTVGSGSLNTVLNAAVSNMITINTSGAVTINAGVGTATPTSVAPDGIIKLLGADWVTIDGLTFTDGNAANPATMEYGIGLFKFSAADGSRNNTIKNCTINMQRINNASSTAPMFEGAVGILVINSTPTTATTSLTPSVAAGSNSNNKLYTNTINGGNYGIGLSGFAASSGVGPAPTASTFLGDLSNDIGGTSALTGNTILNYGGGGTTNASAGIRANNQWSVNIQYNTVNNNNGSGVNHGTTLRGIYGQAGTSASATISNNTITLQCGATTSTASAIENAIGSTAASNTVTIASNTIRVAYTTATTGVMNGILNSSTAATVTINLNNIQGVTSTNLAGTGVCIGIVGGSTGGTLNITNNTVSNISRSGASGTFRAITAATPPTMWNCTGNTIENISYTNATSTGSIDGIYDFSSALNMNISTNIVRNLSTPTTGTIEGIRIFTSSGGSSTCNANQVYNFSTTAGGAGGANMYGIYWSVGSVNITNNLVYSLNSTGTTGGTAGALYGIWQSGGNTQNITGNKIYDISSNSTNPVIAGIHISGGTTNNLNNNIVGDLRATFSTGNAGLSGILIAGGTTNNIFHNTVYLSSTTSSATTFGSSGIYVSSSTPVNNVRNNIFVNNSDAGPTGGYTSALRYVAAPTSTNFPALNDKNLYYVSSAAANRLIYGEGTAATATNGQQTITAYKTYINTTLPVAGREATSVSESPNWLSTSGASANFLHIDASIATLIESGGSTGTGVTVDFDGATRNSPPDIGADEFSGISPAPAITLNSITPSTNQCVATARLISVNVTTPAGIITGVTITYNNGTLNSNIPMTNTVGNTWEYTIPAASPTNTTVTWSITATNDVPLNAIYTGASYADDPLFGVYGVITASVNPICAGSPSSLTASLFTTGVPAVPAASSYCQSTHTSGCSGDNMSLIVMNTMSSSASACGLSGSTPPRYLYTPGSQTTLTAGSNYSIAVTFGTDGSQFFGAWMDYNHNGSYEASEFFASNSTTAGASGTATVNFTVPLTAYTGLTHMRIIGGNDAAVTSGQACGASSSPWGETQDYDVTISGGLTNAPFPGAISSITWNDGTSNIGITNPISVSPSIATTYTATIASTGCNVTPNPSISLNIAAPPTNPTANNAAAQCPGVPLSSVTSTSGIPTPTFKWYSAATGGTMLQQSTSTTYTTSISTTTTFHVSEIDLVSGCESGRVPVVCTVHTLSITSGVPNFCSSGGAQTTTLTAVSSNGSFTYAWSGTSGTIVPATGSPVTINITATTDYTLTATDGACVMTVSKTIGVYDFPSINLSSNGPVCEGSTISLNSGIVAGSFTAACITPPAGLATPGPGAVQLCNAGAATVPLSGGSLDDGYWNAIPIPFTFNYFGTGYTSLNIGTNGNVNFGATGTTQYNFTGGFPSLSNPANTIAVCARDLQLGATGGSFSFGTGKITYWTEGVTPNRKFIVQYANCATWYSTNASDGYSSAEAVFYETIGSVDIRVIAATNPAATSGTFINDTRNKYIGLQDGTRTVGATSPNCNTLVSNYWNGVADEITTPQAWRFDPASHYTITWTGTNLVPPTTGTDLFTIATTAMNTPGTYNYTFVGTDQTTGCTNSLSPANLNVVVTPLPVAPVVNGTTICGASSVTLTVSNAASIAPALINWYDAPVGGTLLFTGASYITPVISGSTSYYVESLSGTCANSGGRTQVNINVISPPLISASGPGSQVCPGDPITLNVTSSNGGYTYVWNPGSLAGAAQNINAPASTTTYTVVATDNTAGPFATCTTSSQVIVNVHNTPTPNAGADQLKNIGTTANLLATYISAPTCLKITEITLNRFGIGTTPTYPAYATGQDLVEITNLGTTAINIDGLHFKTEGSVATDYVFPAATVPAGGVVVVNVETGTNDIPNLSFFTNTGGDVMFSGSANGIWLTTASGEIIDAVATNAHTFSPGSGVTAADWNGAGASGISGDAGTRLTGADLNDATNWITAGSSTQNIGTINSGLPSCTPPTYTVTWSGGNLVAPVVANPVTTPVFIAPPQTYTYSVSLNDGVCTTTDNVDITTQMPLPPTADFTVNSTSQTTGYTTSTATFTDISLNVPDTWLWNITGPGTVTYVNSTTTASQNPQVQFGAVGQYTVALTVTNAAGNDTKTQTNYITVTATYCPSNATNTADEEIYGVIFAGISNPSTCATTGGAGSILNEYSNYTGIAPGQAAVGYTYPFTLNTSACGTGTYSAGYSVFIDFNGDGDFVDLDEKVLGSVTTTPIPPGSPAGSVITQFTGNVVIPATATLGLTRMRVTLQESNATPLACGTYGYGETEDYTINLFAVTAAPNCVASSTSNFTCITAPTISWPAASGYPTGYYVSYGLTPAGNDLGTINVGNVTTATLPTLNASTLYYYLIEPYNAIGTATGCTVSSNTTGGSVTQTPTQSSSSYTETIDNSVAVPALPCGMTGSDENFPNDGVTWKSANGAGNAHAGTRYLSIDKNPNNTTAKDDWFYSAPMNLTAGKLYRIYFWHRVGAAGSENFEVFLSNSNDAATMLTTSAVFNGASNLLTYKLDSSADILPVVGGIYYYGFHANGAANGQSLYMDDIQVKQIPVAAMDPASCVTIPSLYDQLLVQPVYQAQDYKFKIENLANSFSYEYTRNLPIPDFRLKWAPGVTYDLTYDVSVSYKKNNVWSPYGPSCPVTMGPFPTTQLRGASCGATLTDLYTPLYIDSVGGANDYEYRIVQNTLAYDHTWMRGAPALDYRLYWAYQTSPLLVERVQFGFTYDVQVRALVGRTGPAQGNLPGTLGTFGPTCTVTLSGQPQTQLVAAPGPQQSCGKTLTNITDQIFCIPVVGAGNYRYTAVNAALGYNATADRNSTLNDFRLNWLPTVGGVGLRYATTYDITVQNNVGGVWSTAGAMCQVTTPAQPLTQLQPAYCLYTLPTFSTPIYCNAVPAATNYRYRITDVATSGATYTKIIDRNAPSTDFRFTWTLVCCGGLNVLPNTPYNVEVASYAGGVWSAYGAVCTVTTSATVPRYNPFLAEDGKVEAAAAELGLSVYPNPSAVNETYYVELNGIQQANEKVAINIYNVLGAKVYSTQVITKEESRVVLQPEQTLAAGVYTVEAQINGTVSRVKFVVK